MYNWLVQHDTETSTSESQVSRTGRILLIIKHDNIWRNICAEFTIIYSTIMKGKKYLKFNGRNPSGLSLRGLEI